MIAPADCENKVVMGMGKWTSRSSTDTTTVGVRVPARLEQLTMLRALAETVALIADFALDEVTDIRLALDEVATSLILDAVPGSTIDCDFTYDTDQMFVHASSIAGSASVVDESDFGWHIIRTLTESIATVQSPYDGVLRGYPTIVDFSWVRGAPDAW
ncbi:anti-sigma factor [Nocardia sp. NPDC049220]|uniref:ATP-binding protein n=1 Tax=Nocardia sp. NPDC049220 TaxID=3155273 RepID=UPI0033FD03A2